MAIANNIYMLKIRGGNSYEEYQQQIKKLNGKTAEEYKAQILARLPEFRKQITQSKGSPAYKEIINTDLELSAARMGWKEKKQINTMPRLRLIFRKDIMKVFRTSRISFHLKPVTTADTRYCLTSYAV